MGSHPKKVRRVSRSRQRRCPVCRKPAEPPWRPFCSKRCADVDLGRWLGEAYRVPSTDEDDEGIDEDPEAGA